MKARTNRKERPCKTHCKVCDYFGDLGGQDQCECQCRCSVRSQVFTFEVPGKDVPMYLVGNPLDTRKVPVRYGNEIVYYDPVKLIKYLRSKFCVDIPFNVEARTIIIPFDVIDVCTQKIVGSFISIPTGGVNIDCACPEIGPGSDVKTNFTFTVWDYFTLGPCKELVFEAVPSDFPYVVGTTEMRARIADVTAPVVDYCTSSIQTQVYDHHNAIFSNLVASSGFSRSCKLPRCYGTSSENTMILRVNGNINASKFINVPDPLDWLLTFDGIGTIKTAKSGM